MGWLSWIWLVAQARHGLKPSILELLRSHTVRRERMKVVV